MTNPSEALTLTGAETAVVGATPLGKREIDLDVARGLAILLAMGWHFNGAPIGQGVVDAVLAPGRVFGWAGVDLFFVLSGFLVGRLVFREHLRHGRFDYARFFVRRAFKLWPNLYIFLLVMLVIGGVRWAQFFWQIGLHLQNYFQPKIALHCWSLAVEEHFYLALGLLFPVYVARGGSRRGMIWILLGVMTVCPLLRLVGEVLGASPVALQTQTHYRVDALACGVLLALLSTHYEPLFNRLNGWRWLWAALATLGYSWLVFVPKTSVLGCVAGFTVSYLAAAALLLLIYRSGIERLAVWPCQFIAFIGVYSYSVYLWHPAVGKAVEIVTNKGHLAQYAALVVALKYATSIMVAVLLTMAVEAPMLRLRERIAPARAHAV